MHCLLGIGNKVKTMRRVVITGMGVVSPLGNTVDDFWNGLVAGRSAAKSLKEIIHCNLFEHLNVEFASQVITEVEQFEEAQQLPDEVRQRDRYTQFAIAAALQSVRDARLDTSSDAMREDWGITFATAAGSAQATEAAYSLATEYGSKPLDPQKIPSGFYLDWICDAPTILLAQLLDVHGPCDTMTSACSSGVDVIGHAYELIQDGEATIMLVGASEACTTPGRFAACDIIHALAACFNDQPERASRPFDMKRGGFVMGEGAASFILEEREHALSRGAHIYGEITGFGLTSNATHMTDLKPTVARHIARALKRAMDEAGIVPEDVHYINPHASSTSQNDQTETLAIKEVLGAHAYNVPMSATKSEIGHPLGVSGFYGAMVAVLSLATGVLHPTINYEDPDPLCDLDCVPNEARQFTGTNALVIASGFSGTHAALVVQKAER